MLDLNKYRAQILSLCRALGVRRLELVGSAARKDFCPESSDIDVLIEFNGTDALFDRYFNLKSGLESIFGRKVDVIQRGAVKNPYLIESLNHDRIAVYET
ncbi:nucleotidyltransferase domain-containing protein [bacterium]|nr:nucleotidyltransferase domain-containing protein [bacterium]MBU1652024.1 nucleotidyltransferase domain-containing protein [bacterium]